MTKRKHPYQVMGLRVGTEIWVRAKITQLSAPNTLGYAHGFISVSLETKNGMAGGGSGTVTIFDVRKAMNQRTRRKPSRLSPLERAAMRWFRDWSHKTEVALAKACAAALKKGKR